MVQVNCRSWKRLQILKHVADIERLPAVSQANYRRNNYNLALELNAQQQRSIWSIGFHAKILEILELLCNAWREHQLHGSSWISYQDIDNFSTEEIPDFFSVSD